jgi:hypothetical protein
VVRRHLREPRPVDANKHVRTKRADGGDASGLEHSKKNRAQFHRQKIHSECGVSAKTIVYLIQQFHLGNNFISPARRG